MKRFSIIFLSLFLISSLIPLSYADSTFKVGVFDLQKVIRESKVVQEYRKTLLTEMEMKRKPLQEKQDSIRLIEERLKNEGKTISLEERRRLEDRRDRDIKEFQRLKEDFDMELRRIDRELYQKVVREVREIVKSIAEKDRLSIVFERLQAGIAYSEDSFDITKKIIEAYDEKK